ncbi:MAG: BlaI/MecI/CopY family transcriptional regulator [Verrucomicrobiota bacterium]
MLESSQVPTPDDPAEIPDFNRTQLHVLQILWNSDVSLKPAEIEAQFEWPIENATLRSVLAVMLERGDLEREKQGKAFFYFARRPKNAAMAEMLSGLAKVFGSSSRVGLFAQLLQEESLSAEEARELREIAESFPSSTKNPNTSNQ